MCVLYFIVVVAEGKMEEDDINETIKEQVATATEDKTMALPTHFLFALSNREEEKPLSRSCSFLFSIIFCL